MSLVEDRVCDGGPYIVAAQDTHDFSVAIELHEEPLLHVLVQLSAQIAIRLLTREEGEQGTFLSSGWACGMAVGRCREATECSR